MARAKQTLPRNLAILVVVVGLGVQIVTTCYKKSDTTPSTKQQPPSTASTATPNQTGTIHLEMGIPTGGDGEPSYLLKRKQYALSYNGTKNVPNWVSYHLNASYFGTVERKQGQFMPDPDLPPQFYKVRHQDYSNSGFDRGHMVRSEERTATREDNDATFYTTNLLPQRHDLNAGPWLRLEEFCQFLAVRKKKELYIICGGIFPKNYQTIGKQNNIAVPSHCFKIIVVLESGQGVRDVNENTTVIAAIMPNVEGIKKEQWRQYQTTVDEIEQQTGYDFLTAVPQKIQEAIERRIATSLVAMAQ
ncbi:MAG: DNA/RNA non-specific endonuclease [Bacteroidota bacterium]|nr:DNA/RNA non-specific endonuclease [Candidatus Kapabacteria bacterium]MDW8219441.1 DNA/RNA non-specific endonuclease [Bacteroidota bacterium]